jgi:hypothetical protein
MQEITQIKRISPIFLLKPAAGFGASTSKTKSLSADLQKKLANGGKRAYLGKDCLSE